VPIANIVTVSILLTYTAWHHLSTSAATAHATAEDIVNPEVSINAEANAEARVRKKEGIVLKTISKKDTQAPKCLSTKRLRREKLVYT
jgi:hypothetical protein